MLQKERFARVIQALGEMDLEQMVISDPKSIWYLTGFYEFPFERFWVLYVNKNGKHILAANTLFSIPEDIGVPIMWYTDNDNGAAMLVPYIDHSKPLGIDKDLASRFLITFIDNNAASGYINSSLAIDNVRAIKDKDEQEKMRRASLVNDKAMTALKSHIRDGITEQELADKLMPIYKELGAQGFSFEPLVGFGANAALGHHAPDSTILKDGDCILIDIGCKVAGYCSDMTRTYFYMSVSEEHKEVYNTVLKAQKYAESIIKPGVKLCDIDKAARDIISKAGYGKYFTHRLGHFIGVDDHEYGDVSGINEDTAKEGMVFSIEPGIYLPGDIGVRIEDLVLVTAYGAEILNSTDKELQIIL